MSALHASLLALACKTEAIFMGIIIVASHSHRLRDKDHLAALPTRDISFLIPTSGASKSTVMQISR